MISKSCPKLDSAVATAAKRWKTIKHVHRLAMVALSFPSGDGGYPSGL